MPAVSKAQQALFGMAYAVRKGEMKRSEANQEVLDIVDSDMTDKQIKDFASTSRKSLKESLLDALDNKKMHDMAANAMHADIVDVRKRLYHRKSDGSQDVLGHTLKPGDNVLFVSYSNNSFQVGTLVRRVKEGWVTDITFAEAANIFDVRLNEVPDYFETTDDHLIISNWAIICKVNNINKIK